MINPKELSNFLLKKKINFYSGVPDSVLKDFLSCINQNKTITNITCANEGAAVSLTIGNYLGSKKLGLVYFQNSGLGNAINPLISIADKSVYSIPMVLLIGWRGSPNSNDEPQHMAKGKITKSLLKLLDIKHSVIENKKDFKKIEKLIKFSRTKKRPVAILIENKVFSKFKKVKVKDFNKSINRSDFLISLLKNVNNKDKIISTTGYTSRELNKIRKDHKIKKAKDFYMVGGMGHCSSVALGCSLVNDNKIICLDGDGSLLMHMGSIATIGFYSKNNFKYILLNNNSHESVGGQITNISNMNLKLFSKSLGYKKYFLLSKRNETKNLIKSFLKCDGPVFLEVKIRINKSENKLPRPKDLLKVKKDFLSK